MAITELDFGALAAMTPFPFHIPLELSVRRIARMRPEPISVMPRLLHQRFHKVLGVIAIIAVIPPATVTGRRKSDGNAH